MLAYANRLTEQEDFEKVKQKGEAYHYPVFTLLVLDRKSSSASRFGFIVSKKVHPNASLRNRATRGLREAVRQSMFAVKNGYDCVFLAKQEIVKTYTKDLMVAVQDALVKSKVMQ
jgi:ribonuclease P protein component